MKTARQWFRENQAQPNLERLAGHTHPPEVFLGLCAASGQAQFTLWMDDGAGTSYALLHAGQPVVLVILRQAQSVLMDGLRSLRIKFGFGRNSPANSTPAWI